MTTTVGSLERAEAVDRQPAKIDLVSVMSRKNVSVQDIVDASKTAYDHRHDHDYFARAGGDFSETYKLIVQLQQQDKPEPRKLRADLTELSTQLPKLQILNDFEITGADDDGHFTATRNGDAVKVVASAANDFLSPSREQPSFWQSTKNVAGAIGDGVLNEATEHIDRVALLAVTGFAVGVGSAFLAPEIVTVAAVAGTGLAAYQLAKHVPQWYHDAKVVANPYAYSDQEQEQAADGVQGLGAGAVDVAAGLLGGLAGNKVGAWIASSLAPVNYDGQGRPTKIPDQNGRPTYVKYDDQGNVTEFKRDIGSYWTETMRQSINADGTRSWTIQSQGPQAYTEPQPWEGTIELNPDGKSLTMTGKGSTMTLNTVGQSVRTQTPEQLEAEKAYTQAFNQSLDKLWADQAASTDTETGIGAGIAAAGLGAMML